MSGDSGQIDRFFDRAGIFTGQSSPEKVQLLIRRFAELPYENVTKIVRFARTSDTELAKRLPDEVLSDHFRWNTGGTCFSLTNTLRRILQEAGFEAQILMADMKVGQDIHCAIRLPLEGRSYLVDPGYLLDRPIPLMPNQVSVHETVMNTILVEPVDDDSGWNVSVVRKGEKKLRYRLKPHPVTEVDFQRHWDKSFTLNMMNSLTLSQVTPAGQIYLSRSRLHLVQSTGRQARNIRGVESEAISEMFHLDRGLVEQAIGLLEERRQNHGHDQSTR
jgi:arylamine N-acetyltransferase